MANVQREDDLSVVGLYTAERNLDTMDYDVLEEESNGADSDEVAIESLHNMHPRIARSQMGSAMSSGMQTGGTSVDKLGSGMSSWGTSVSNIGQGWTSFGQAVQTVDEKIG